MEQAKIDRINQLAQKHRTEGLTEEETTERQALRAEYIADVRKSLEATLGNVYLESEDGEYHPLTRKE